MGAEPQMSQRDRRREKRDAWCAERRLGDHTAVFYPGDELRCPATKQLSGGGKVICGSSLELTVRPQTQAIVRLRSFRDPPSPTGLNALCHMCRAALEVFTLAEATG